MDDPALAESARCGAGGSTGDDLRWHRSGFKAFWRWKNWRTFLGNHAGAIAAIDVCVVPTLTFERLFAFIVLGRRQLLWFAVTRNPTAEWLAQQYRRRNARAPTNVRSFRDHVAEISAGRCGRIHFFSGGVSQTLKS
jgi:hypothetical protein